MTFELQSDFMLFVESYQTNSTFKQAFKFELFVLTTNVTKNFIVAVYWSNVFFCFFFVFVLKSLHVESLNVEKQFSYCPSFKIQFAQSMVMTSVSGVFYCLWELCLTL